MVWLILTIEPRCLRTPHCLQHAVESKKNPTPQRKTSNDASRKRIGVIELAQGMGPLPTSGKLIDYLLASHLRHPARFNIGHGG